MGGTSILGIFFVLVSLFHNVVTESNRTEILSP